MRMIKPVDLNKKVRGSWLAIIALSAVREWSKAQERKRMIEEVSTKTSEKIYHLVAANATKEEKEDTVNTFREEVLEDLDYLASQEFARSDDSPEAQAWENGYYEGIRDARQVVTKA